MLFTLLGLILTLLIKYSVASIGDASPYFQKCLESCSLLNCMEDEYGFKNFEQPVVLHYMGWHCQDQCKYDCMWKTVDAFHERHWRTPQFYGKWPFLRILGMQEPASVIFSLLNAYIHVRMIQKFHKEVRSDSPLIWLWQSFFLVSLNAWIWSAIFHTRDIPMTELLDYICAFSMVVMAWYVMMIRLTRGIVPLFALAAVTIFCWGFFINHATYLSMTDRIDYGYNMYLNLIVGTFTALCWFAWCLYNKKGQPYVWKCVVYVSLTGIAMLLELIDMPPLLYILDFHALWHLATAPLVILIYSFAIDDCKYLRKLEHEATNHEGRKNI